MDDQLRYFLMEGPQSVANLARLTGKSTSGIYKTLNKHTDEVKCKKDSTGTNVFWMEASAQEAPASPSQDESEGQVGDPTSIPADASESTLEAAPAAKGKRGRKPTAAGQRLFPAVEGTITGVGADGKPTDPPLANVRRKGSHGYRSLQIVIDNPGITTEEFVAKGGRLNDLRWDINQGNVRVES